MTDTSASPQPQPSEQPPIDLPDTYFLPASRTRWIFTFVISTVVVIANIVAMSAGGGGALGLLAMIFSVTGIAAGTQLVPGSAGIWLDRKGFVFRMFWVDRRREWDEISPVLSSQVGLMSMVGYSRKDDKPNKPREVLPDTYGMSAHDLADMMNLWRNRAILAAGA